MFTPLHKHLLIKAYVPNRFTDVELAKSMLLDIVYTIKMKPVTKPQAYFVEDLGNVGLTGSINLATSHVAFHHWLETGLLMMDVYSCKDFDGRLILKAINDYFGEPLTLHVVEFDRDDMKVMVDYRD